MTLLELERAIHTDLAIGRIADGWLHRATRETDAGLIHGRADLMAATARELAATGAQTITSAIELPGFLAVEVEDARGDIWRRHRWCALEAGRIAHEVLVADRHPGAEPPAVRWPILGEVESGRGQRAAPLSPVCADEPPARAAGLADLIHTIVNGRRFDLAAPAFAPGGVWHGPDETNGPPEALAPALVRLLAAAPDVTVVLDRASAAGDAAATLWRVGATLASGARVTGFASCLARYDDDAIARLEFVFDAVGMFALASAPAPDF